MEQNLMKDGIKHYEESPVSEQHSKECEVLWQGLSLGHFHAI